MGKTGNAYTILVGKPEDFEDLSEDRRKILRVNMKVIR
jgi:hypothetical protein